MSATAASVATVRPVTGSSNEQVLPMPFPLTPGTASGELSVPDTGSQQRMITASRDKLAGMGTGGRGGTVSPSGTVIIELIVNGQVVETTEA
jgi:hypothetical protein